MLTIVHYYLVIASYKYEKKKSLLTFDSRTEYSSLISCLGEISDFAVDRLNFYQEKNKDKGSIDLIRIRQLG